MLGAACGPGGRILPWLSMYVAVCNNSSSGACDLSLGYATSKPYSPHEYYLIILHMRNYICEMAIEFREDSSTVQ